MTEQAADALIVICGLLGWSVVIALSTFGCIVIYDLRQEQKERKRRRMIRSPGILIQVIQKAKERKRRRMIRREMNRSRGLSQHGM